VTYFNVIVLFLFQKTKKPANLAGFLRKMHNKKA